MKWAWPATMWIDGQDTLINTKFHDIHSPPYPFSFLSALSLMIANPPELISSPFPQIAIMVYSCTYNIMSLNQQIILLQQKYQQLPRAASIPEKRALIDEIRVIGSQVQVLATAEQNRAKLRQLKGVLAVVGQIQLRLDQPSSIIPEDSQRSSIEIAVDMLVYKSIVIQNLEGSPQQFAEVRRRIAGAAGVMQVMGEIVREEKEDLAKIEENIDLALEKAEPAEEELQDAAQRTKRGRLRKLRTSIMGVLASLGYYILGLPGMAIGAISAWLF